MKIKTLESISDENLYFLCQKYGENARYFRQKFSGLLPEVFKRRLYLKKGFSSIFEFAKKLAGLSEEQTRLVLNLEKRFENTPVLKSLLITGKVSVNKLARVVSIAKPENEEFLATQVQVLSKSAVETLVRDEKFENQNGLQNSFFESKSLPGQTMQNEKNQETKGKLPNENLQSQKTKTENTVLQLSPEVQRELLELQQKGIDINTLLLEFLQKREQEISQRKEEITQQILQREQQKTLENKPISRHVPTAAQKILNQEFGQKCSIKNCQKSATQIHHTQRFSASHSHDPRYLAPLCKEHHELAHNLDMNYLRIKNKIETFN